MKLDVEFWEELRKMIYMLLRLPASKHLLSESVYVAMQEEICAFLSKYDVYLKADSDREPAEFIDSVYKRLIIVHGNLGDKNIVTKSLRFLDDNRLVNTHVYKMPEIMLERYTQEYLGYLSEYVPSAVYMELMHPDCSLKYKDGKLSGLETQYAFYSMSS